MGRSDVVGPVRNRWMLDSSESRRGLMRSEVFPTGVIWLTFAPTAKPADVGYDDIKGLVPHAAEATPEP